MPSGSAAARQWPPDVAGRTYLQRIAQPLRPGDPVLFAMPQVAPDDARPPATPPVTSAAPASGPVLRRTPSRVASPAPMQAPSPRSAMSPAPANAAAPPPAMSAHGPDSAVASPVPAPVVAGEPPLITALALTPPAMQAPLAAAPAPMDVPAASPLELRTTEAVAPTAPTPTVPTSEPPSASVAAAIDPPAAARNARRCAAAGPRGTARSAPRLVQRRLVTPAGRRRRAFISARWRCAPRLRRFLFRCRRPRPVPHRVPRRRRSRVAMPGASASCRAEPQWHGAHPISRTSPMSSRGCCRPRWTAPCRRRATSRSPATVRTRHGPPTATAI